MSSIHQIAFEAVHRLKESQTHVEIYTELRRYGGIFGFEAFLIAGAPRASHENLSDCSIISGWPPEWERRYQEQRYMHVDPVIRRVRETVDPFLWQEAVDVLGTPQGMAVFGEARAFGLNAGLCVPFHELDGSESGISFGGAHFAPSPDELAGLHLIGIYAMSSTRAIGCRQIGKNIETRAATPLTNRETECVKWAAAGKTACDTADILSISYRTVESHLANAARKLDAVSGTQCVAEAIRRGLIA